MNYKVLYRKYRPSTFKDVVGQDRTIELLKDSVINDKISHAYIFTGPRGTGKTSTAKIFAKTINCLNSKDGEPCNECENCKNFQQSSDIYEIDAASNNGVDQVREIIDNIKLTPASSKYKVYIIDEVHMLSDSAFNALLLTLEEPPSHVVFILATTDIEEVPITVLSRCQRLDFQKISNKAIVENMKMIAEKEKIDIDTLALEEIADFADGGMRDALSILDQLSKNNVKITQEIVLESLGLISNKEITNVIEAIDNNDVDKVLEFIKFAQTHSTDFKTLCKKLIRAIEKKAIGVKLGTAQTNLDYTKLKNLALEISSLIYKCNVNIDPYVNLELVMLDYIDKFTKNISREIKKGEEKELWEINTQTSEPKEEDVKITKKQIKDNEQLVSDIEIKKDFPSNSSELCSIRVNNCFVNANKNFLTEAKDMWVKFINLNKMKKERALLMDTNIVLASDSILVIQTDIKETAEEINDNIIAIEDALNTYINKKYKLTAVCKEQWNNYMQEYKEKLAKNIKYEMIDEPKVNDSKKIVEDIFLNSKIEVK